MSQLTTILDTIFQNNGGTTRDWRKANEILLTKSDEIKKYCPYIKNKIRDLNKDIQLLALDFLDYSMDDGKIPLWTQVGTKDFLTSLVNIYKTRSDEKVQNKILYLIKKWGIKFQKYNTIIPNFSSIYENLKQNDVDFPKEEYSTYEKYLQGPGLQTNFSGGTAKMQKIYQNNNSENVNYLKNLNLDLRDINYHKKYKRLVNKLDDWTQQIQDANVYMDNLTNGDFDDELRGICNELTTGKKQLIDTIDSGKLKDDNLMEISMNVLEDLNSTLKRWEEVKNGRTPPKFISSFFSQTKNYSNNNINTKTNNNSNNSNQGNLDLLGFEDDSTKKNENTNNNNLFDIFSNNNSNTGNNNNTFNDIGVNNQTNNNDLLGINNVPNQNSSNNNGDMFSQIFNNENSESNAKINNLQNDLNNIYDNTNNINNMFNNNILGNMGPNNNNNNFQMNFVNNNNNNSNNNNNNNFFNNNNFNMKMESNMNKNNNDFNFDF